MAKRPATAPDEGLTSVVGELYEAVEDPLLWPAVLDRIAELLRGESTFLAANCADAVATDVRAIARADPAAVEAHRSHYDATNVWTRPCDRMFGILRLSAEKSKDLRFQRSTRRPATSNHVALFGEPHLGLPVENPVKPPKSRKSPQPSHSKRQKKPQTLA
jgi:hypothetical protein